MSRDPEMARFWQDASAAGLEVGVHIRRLPMPEGGTEVCLSADGMLMLAEWYASQGDRKRAAACLRMLEAVS